MKHDENETVLSNQEFEELMQELPGILDQLEQEAAKQDCE